MPTRSIAVGNNPSVSKRNVIVAKVDVEEKMRLVQDIEDLIITTETTDGGMTPRLVSGILSLLVDSDQDEKEALQDTVRELLLLRSEPIKLHSSIIATVTLMPINAATLAKLKNNLAPLRC